MKALEGAFNQEKALVGAFSVIVQPVVEPMDRFTAIVLDVHVRRVEDVATEGDSAGHLDQRQLRISETGAKSNIADVDSSLCFPDRPFVFVHNSCNYAKNHVM